MQQLLKENLLILKTRMYIKGYRNIYIRWKNSLSCVPAFPAAAQPQPEGVYAKKG
jgi:hypothetical protein